MYRTKKCMKCEKMKPLRKFIYYSSIKNSLKYRKPKRALKAWCAECRRLHEQITLEQTRLLAQGFKRCVECDEVLSVDNFPIKYKKKKKIRESRCKSCHNERERRKRKIHKYVIPSSGVLKCRMCKKLKTPDNFYKDSAKKTGYGTLCIDCEKDKYTKISTESFINPINYIDRLPPSDKPTKCDLTGSLRVKCKKCGSMFYPTTLQTQLRIRAYEGTLSGESNFYCSEKCKRNCELFGFQPLKHVDPRSKLYIPPTKIAKVRNCQNDTLKQIQCEEAGHNYCEKCGDIIDVDLHHTLPAAVFGEKAINPAGHMLLCAGCHVQVHRLCEAANDVL